MSIRLEKKSIYVSLRNLMFDLCKVTNQPANQSASLEFHRCIQNIKQQLVMLNRVVI